MSSYFMVLFGHHEWFTSLTINGNGGVFAFFSVSAASIWTATNHPLIEARSRIYPVCQVYPPMEGRPGHRAKGRTKCGTKSARTPTICCLIKTWSWQGIYPYQNCIGYKKEGSTSKWKEDFMKRLILCSNVLLICLFQIVSSGGANEAKAQGFSFQGLEDSFQYFHLPDEAKEYLKQNGFVVTPGREKEIFDVYRECKKRRQPIFVTTDAVLHTSHIFFDYLLRILEIEKLYDKASELTDRMIDLSIQQYNQATNADVKEAARLNIGFFTVAKRSFDPDYHVGYELEDIVAKEIRNIEEHEGLRPRELLTYVKTPAIYALEDYSQYLPRGHYTRNEKFKSYFKAMMWYGRIDFKLKPGKTEEAASHGRMMTLQALLMTDALRKDQEAYRLWKEIYEPTLYFVGKTDDLHADDYMELLNEIFPAGGAVDAYGDRSRLSEFIDRAAELRPPRILSGAAFVEDGEFAVTTKGFRFMGQRFIPDSYMFQELVFGRKDTVEILRYTGNQKPFTMEIIVNRGPGRAFPRGLDILAVLGSKRALEILEKDGDTEYEYYYEQLNKLKQEFSSLTAQDWKQNLYFRWLYCLLPLLEEDKEDSAPEFMQSTAWTDKELQTTLGSWAELRHDVILYAKQSYPMVATGMPSRPELTFGYVEPYPEVYGRLEEMMRDLRDNLDTLGIAPEGVHEKLKSFENILAKLKAISEKELDCKILSDEEYELIWNIGEKLASLKRFSPEIMQKITSGADERMDLIADVHTDLNTKQVLEEGVGSPFDIFVIVEDAKGKRLCRGGVFSYYEFKHPLDDRLTDEKWQKMGKESQRPPQPDWVGGFTAE